MSSARVLAAVRRIVDVYTGTEFKAALQVWAAARSPIPPCAS